MDMNYWNNLVFQLLPFLGIFAIIFFVNRRKGGFGGYLQYQQETLQVLKEIRDILKNK